MISQHTSDDIPSQMKILNVVIPFLMHFCGFKLEHCKSHLAARHPEKSEILIDVKQFATV